MQQKELKLVCALFLLLAIEAFSADQHFDTNFLESKAKTDQAPNGNVKAVDGKKENRSKFMAEEQKADAKLLKSSVDTINSISLLLKTIPSGVNRNNLLLNRAASYNAYSRQRILAQKNGQSIETLKKYLDGAVVDVQEVLKSPVITKDQKWRAHDIAGVSYLYLDQEKMAVLHFLELLNSHPPDAKAGRIGLLVAEDLFDKEKYAEAADFYTKYFDKMAPQLKELSLYKLGWCSIKLNQQERALKYFAKVARSSSNSGIGRDATRDLAYFVTHGSNPMADIASAEKEIGLPEDRLSFLHEVRGNFELQGAVENHNVIVSRLLQQETKPDKREELYLANLRVLRKPYASQEHMAAFVGVVESLKKIPSASYPAVFQKYSSEIETETQSIIKAHVDTYAGRIKTAEGLSKNELVENLKTQFSFYDHYFSAQKTYPAIVSIWNDVCLDVKDWACVESVSQIMISKPDRFAGNTEKAYLDQITALEQLVLTTTNKSVKEQYSDKRATRIKEFVEKFPQSPQWLIVAKIYTSTEIDRGHEKEALPVLQQMMTRFPSDDSFYRLQYARFKMGDFDGVLNDPATKTYAIKGAKVLELYRESSLALAQKAKAADQLDGYRNNINRFLSLSEDPEKNKIARLDYFNFLVSSKRAEVAEQELFRLPAEDLRSKDFSNVRLDLWKSLFSDEKYDLATKSATESLALDQSDEWLHRKLISQLAANQNTSLQELSGLSKEPREYFLGIFVLTSPSKAIEYYKSKKGALNDGEKKLLALAYRVMLDQSELPRTPELESLLGKSYPFKNQADQATLPVEKNIMGIAFPALEKMSAQKQSAIVKRNIDGVRWVRSSIPRAIKNKPSEVQIRVLARGKDLEERMGNYLIHSPVPGGLSPQQKAEYQKAIESAASEFFQQAKEMETLSGGISGENAKLERQQEARTLPQPDLSRWPWRDAAKNDPSLGVIIKSAESGNASGAIAILDYYRSKLVKSDQDYFALRAGVLLSGQAPATLRRYVLEELERNKQDSLIRTWAGLVGKPVPESK